MFNASKCDRGYNCPRFNFKPCPDCHEIKVAAAAAIGDCTRHADAAADAATAADARYVAAMDEAQPYTPSDGPDVAYTAQPKRHPCSCECGHCDDDGYPHAR